MQNFENLVETQVESREIFDGHIMHVFKDTVRLPNGADASREYMRHIGGGAHRARSVFSGLRLQ